MQKLFLLPASLILVLSLSGAYSEENKPVEISKAWSTFVCYNVTSAIKMLAFKNGEKLSSVSRDKGRIYIQMDKKKSK